MLTSLWSWLAYRLASLERFSRRMADGGGVSIFRRGGDDGVVGFRMDTIAIVEPLEPGSTGVLDTGACYLEWWDVGSAMRHVNAHYPGRYTVFQDPSGRVFLQDEDESRGKGPSGRRFPRPGKF